MSSIDQLTYIAVCAICFVPAIVFHEVAHGLMANALGDPTAKAAGRLTFNPLAHIDPFGTVILPLLIAMMGGAVFGYAKPVPYNPRYFKDMRKGDVLVGIAGPAANLVMALVGALLTWVLYLTSDAWAQAYYAGGFAGWILGFLMMLFPQFTLINLYLLFFNMLPIPPLDGSSILAILVPEKHMNVYYAVERYAMPIFLIVAFAIPYATGINPFGIYLDATAGNLASLLLP